MSSVVAQRLKPSALVEIVLQSRGRRMSEGKFAQLSDKEKRRVLRNRKTAKATRQRRLDRLKQLNVDNKKLAVAIAAKERQIEMLLSCLPTLEDESDLR